MSYPVPLPFKLISAMQTNQTHLAYYAFLGHKIYAWMYVVCLHSHKIFTRIRDRCRSVVFLAASPAGLHSHCTCTPSLLCDLCRHLPPPSFSLSLHLSLLVNAFASHNKPNKSSCHLPLACSFDFKINYLL